MWSLPPCFAGYENNIHRNNSNSHNQINQAPDLLPQQAKSPTEPLSPRTDEAGYQKLPLKYRPKAGRAQCDPLDYDSHPYPAMKQFAGFLALRFDSPRTRHSYYRQIRLVHEFCACDPATLTEEQFRDYILHVKTKKLWQPKTIRQAAAAARLFFVEMMEHADWKVFSQIRTKNHDHLPAVLTRDEIKLILNTHTC